MHKFSLILNYVVGARTVLTSCLGLEALNENIESEKLPSSNPFNFGVPASAIFQRLQFPNRFFFTVLLCQIPNRRYCKKFS